MVTEKLTWKNVLTHWIRKLSSMDCPKKVSQIVTTLSFAPKMVHDEWCVGGKNGLWAVKTS